MISYFISNKDKTLETCRSLQVPPEKHHMVKLVLWINIIINIVYQISGPGCGILPKLTDALKNVSYNTSPNTTLAPQPNISRTVKMFYI